MRTLPKSSKKKAMTNMPLNLDTLPSRRDEAWKWTDLRGQVSEGQAGLSAEGTPKFTPPKGVTVSQAAQDAGSNVMSVMAANFAD